MKPKIIGDFTDFADQKPQAPAVRLTLSAGEVEAMICEADEWDFPLLISAVRAAGYEPVRRRHYSPYDFTIVQDSVSWHVDHDCYLSMIMLVEKDDPWTPAQLITKHGPLDLRIGDIAVFNASLGHAWISNGYCALATMTVKRRHVIANPTA